MKAVISFSAIIIAISIILIKLPSRNNVCKTFEDYYSNRDNNKNCYYNPDGKLTTPEVIQRWGYSVETHEVITEDGYILTLFRILQTTNTPSRKPSQPVLIQHGYKSNSKCFVSTGKKSLGFLLAHHGYDVWLSNFRGTIYSRNHTHLKNTDDSFWDFSFHELGVYDVPATINYINQLTKQKLIYIGYSMGGTASTIYAITYPETAVMQVKMFIQLAPFIFVQGISWYTNLGLKIWPYIASIAQALTGGQFYPVHYTSTNTAVWKFLCSPYPFQMGICTFTDMLIYGFDYEQVDPETFPVTALSLIDTVSIKTVTHISQLKMSGKFQNFDYGTQKNLERYESIQPPLYDLSKVQVPMYIIRADNDFTSGKEGVEKFNSSLPEKAKPYDIFVVDHDKFNHVDFIVAKDVVPLLYNHLLKFMKNL